MAAVHPLVGIGTDPDQVAAADLSSELWSYISTHNGPIRLDWPQVQWWAQADGRTLGALASEISAKLPEQR